jgi:hypothetical protein
VRFPWPRSAFVKFAFDRFAPVKFAPKSDTFSRLELEKLAYFILPFV